jgi:hypothetical protein
MLHTKFFDSESVAELSIRQRLLVLGIIANADDQGRIKANPRWLRSKIFPYDEISAQDIREDIQLIESANDTIQCYQVDGKQYIQLINWWEYQSPQWAKKSEYPAPEGWEDRIREMKYKPKRWVYTKNWEGSEDYLTYKVMASGNKSPNKPANRTKKKKVMPLPIFNTNTIINAIPKNIDSKVLRETLQEFDTHRKQIKKPLTELAAKKLLNKLGNYSGEVAIRALNESMENGWQGVFPDKIDTRNSKRSTNPFSELEV